MKDKQTDEIFLFRRKAKRLMVDDVEGALITLINKLILPEAKIFNDFLSLRLRHKRANRMFSTNMANIEYVNQEFSRIEYALIQLIDAVQIEDLK